jgi:hypothetical protein
MIDRAIFYLNCKLNNIIMFLSIQIFFIIFVYLLNNAVDESEIQKIIFYLFILSHLALTGPGFIQIVPCFFVSHKKKLPHRRKVQMFHTIIDSPFLISPGFDIFFLQRKFFFFDTFFLKLVINKAQQFFCMLIQLIFRILLIILVRKKSTNSL